MKNIFCVFKNNILVYATCQVNPLLTDAILGFKALALNHYNDELEAIHFGDYVGSIECKNEYTVVVFSKLKYNLKDVIRKIEEDSSANFEKYDFLKNSE